MAQSPNPSRRDAGRSRSRAREPATVRMAPPNGVQGPLPERYADPVQIGAGGMGEVYRATDRMLERTVAVKLLSAATAGDTEARERFTREALAAARLSDHAHVVDVYDVGEWHGRPYLVMEYLSGGTVADRIRAERIPPAQALVWLEQAAEAIDAIHGAQLVHRDITPGNLLLDDRGQVKLGDFGIVRITNAAPGMTTIGLPVGSVGYMSPEQLRGEPTGPATDIYGLGAVAYEMLCGARPFSGATAADEIAAHLNEPPPPASERRPDLPAQADAVLARALAKLPAGRPRTARQFVSELAEALAAAPGTAAPTPSRLHPLLDAPPPRAAPNRKLLALGLGIAAVVVLIVVLIAVAL